MSCYFRRENKKKNIHETQYNNWLILLIQFHFINMRDTHIQRSHNQSILLIGFHNSWKITMKKKKNEKNLFALFFFMDSIIIKLLNKKSTVTWILFYSHKRLARSFSFFSFFAYQSKTVSVLILKFMTESKCQHKT